MTDADKKMIALGQARVVTSVWVDDAGQDAITETLVRPPALPADADWKERAAAVSLWQVRRLEMQAALRNKAQGGNRSEPVDNAVAYARKLKADTPKLTWTAAFQEAQTKFSTVSLSAIKNKHYEK